MYVDLRVDDHPDPVGELRRLLGIHSMIFEKAKPEDCLPLEGEVLSEVCGGVFGREAMREERGKEEEEGRGRSKRGCGCARARHVSRELVRSWRMCMRTRACAPVQ